MNACSPRMAQVRSETKNRVTNPNVTPPANTAMAAFTESGPTTVAPDHAHVRAKPIPDGDAERDARREPDANPDQV